MWVKDGQLWDGKSIVIDGMRCFNPSKKILEKAGYVWEQPKIEQPIEQPKRYSTLKIIRALGDQWQTYRALMADNGVLDQFFAANYLSEDDEIFMEFMANVPEELKQRLNNQCIWEEN